MSQNRLPDHGGARSSVASVKVARGKYRTFDAWLSGELKKLEARWASFVLVQSLRKTRPR